MTSQIPSSQLLALKETNVSSPSIVHRSKSEQSITASEDYYSLSSSVSNYSDHSATANDRSRSQLTIQRYVTPPSRYRTPTQSYDNLASHDYVAPLRGTGQRRQSIDNQTSGESIKPIVDAPAPSHMREGGIKRKAVPSTVMEGSEGEISPTRARSSAAMALARDGSPPTPGVDDTPFIRFALDQLTRDEEVRGSRRYAGHRSVANDNHPYVVPAQETTARANSSEQYRETDPMRPQDYQRQQSFEEPPPKNPRRLSSPLSQLHQESKRPVREPDVFLPLAADSTRPLHFLPSILRPFCLGLFLLLLVAFLACLLFCAIWSILHKGIWDYGSFGDAPYIVFQYLPTLLGTVLLLWLFQIQVAVTRIAPFLAMSSPIPRLRSHGSELPVFANGFLLPQIHYFRAGQMVIGIFMSVAWLQLFTLPLLASSFNVHSFQMAGGSQWRWLATQGVIWVVIGLYVMLLVSLLVLLVSLARQRETGLKWDPRSLADIFVLLERSNALSAEAAPRSDPARLGYWRTSTRPNEVFHTYGFTNEAPRQYGLEDGRIREKTSHPIRGSGEIDLESGRPWSQRHSKDAMLPKASSDSSEDAGVISVPWYLRLSFTLLWAITAIVLLLAFLIVSYLPSIGVSKGFDPALPAPVNGQGFSSENFFYSFIPALLAEFCLLFWLQIDYSLRYLQAYASLLKPDGELAERSLLLSYTADLPGAVTAAAAANGHWRVAWASFVSLVAAFLPALSGGVFWAQFDVSKQVVRISTDMTVYHVLTAFVVLYALSYLTILPISHTDRELVSSNHSGNDGTTFAGIVALVRHSRTLDDVAFHSPASKIGLVTRLLSAPAAARISQIPEATVSKASLADSVRGFGNARQQAQGSWGLREAPKYALGRSVGRDGREYICIDQVRE